MSTATRTPTEHAYGRVLWPWPSLRLCVVCLAGWLLLSGVAIGMEVAFARFSFKDTALILLVLAFFTLPLAAVSAWPYAFRVDESGIWQRRYWRWDLWPWEAFAGGLIRHTPWYYRWQYPDKPRHSRSMNFAILADADRDWLLELALQVWKPPQVELPEEIKIRLYGIPNKLLELSPRGIVFSRDTGEEIRQYRWSDVVQVRVRRLAHWRLDFNGLELEFPAGEPTEVLGKCPGRAQRNWSGPDAEVVLAYLQRYVGEERVQFTAIMGQLQTPDEAERRRAELARTFRGERIRNRVLWGAWTLQCLLFLSLGGGPLQWDLSKWMLIGCFFAVWGPFGIGIWMASSETRRDYERGLAELAVREAELAGQGP